MNIIAINGSYRGEKGHTHQWLECLSSGARTDGASFEIVNLSRLKINHCLGCNTCHTKDHYLNCIYSEKDDVSSVFSKISAADLVIYATPVYVFGISSLLKTFLDRYYCTSDVDQLRVTRSSMFFHHINESICSKPFVSLICCDNLDAEMPRNGRDYFRTYARFMDAPLVGELIRNSGKIFEKAGNPIGMERFPKIRKVYAAFEQAGYELSQLGRISTATQRQASQEIIPVPFFHLLKRTRFFKKVMVIQASALFLEDS
jgi:hypothetical protein